MIRLEAARRVVDGKFLEAGDVLGKAVQSILDLISSLDRLAETLDPASVDATSGELRSAAASLLTLPETHAERRVMIESVSSLAGALGECVDNLRRHLAYLRAFAINTKITAGGILETGEEFGIFAQEMSDCINLGHTELDAFSKDLARLDAEVGSALSHAQNLGRRCAELLPDVPNALVQSAEAMALHHEKVAGAATGAASIARTVQKKVAGALAALQIGDITRQRIEHVQAGLEMLGESASVDGLDTGQSERLAGAVHELLGRQLTECAADFHQEVAKIGRNMDGLAEDALEILRLRDLAHGRVEGSNAGFLRHLDGSIGQAIGLVGEMRSADLAALEVGRSAAAAAHGLATRVAGIQKIRANVQQMALNATLKCSRIGDVGKPLAVIAVELRMQAGHLDKSAGETLTALDDLTRQSMVLTRGGGSGPGDGDSDEGDPGAATAALEAADGRVRSASESVEADLAELAHQGEAVVEGLRHATSRLNFQGEVGAALDQAADAFSARSQVSTRVDDIQEPLERLLGRIAKQYTMAREREVHQDALTAMGAGGPPAPSPTPEPEDDVLF